MNEARFIKRVVGRALQAGVVLALTIAPASAFAAAPTIPDWEQVSKTLTVDIRSLQPAYAVGDVAKIEVTVRRSVSVGPVKRTGVSGVPVHKADLKAKRSLPAGPDVKGGVPVQGAKVLLIVAVRDRSFYATGVTDDRGRAVMSVKIRRGTPPGAADVTAFAAKKLVDLGCIDHCISIEEWGSEQVKRLFTIKR